MKKQPPDVLLTYEAYDWRQKAQRMSSGWELERSKARELLAFINEEAVSVRAELCLSRHRPALRHLSHEEVVAWFHDISTSRKPYSPRKGLPRKGHYVKGSMRFYSPPEVQQQCQELRQQGYSISEIASLLSYERLGTKPLTEYRQLDHTQINKVFQKLKKASGIKGIWQGLFRSRHLAASERQAQM
jgi:DNA-binding transcriptional MerR regulator